MNIKKYLQFFLLLDLLKYKLCGILKTMKKNFVQIILMGVFIMENNKNKTLDILLKVFLAVGIVAGICVIMKIVYDKYKKNLELLCDDDCDCDFQCLENDELDCDCDNCQYACKPEDVIAEVTEAEIEA